MADRDIDVAALSTPSDQGYVERNGAIPASRFALLRDLDDRDLAPWGVLLETRDGGARLLKFGEWDERVRSYFPDFDQALTTCSRSWLVSAYAREGDDPRV